MLPDCTWDHGPTSTLTAASGALGAEPSQSTKANYLWPLVQRRSLHAGYVLYVYQHILKICHDFIGHYEKAKWAGLTLHGRSDTSWGILESGTSNWSTPTAVFGTQNASPTRFQGWWTMEQYSRMRLPSMGRLSAAGALGRAVVLASVDGMWECPGNWVVWNG